MSEIYNPTIGKPRIHKTVQSSLHSTISVY